MNLADTDWAYLAGLIDSRGCFTAVPDSSHGHPNWKTMLSIYVSDTLTLNYLCDKFGGRIIKQRSKQHKIDRKWRRPYLGWAASAHDIQPLCENVLTYVKRKQQHCKIMVELRKRMNKPKYKKGHIGVLPLTREEIAIRNELAERLKYLNAEFRLNPDVEVEFL